MSTGAGAEFSPVGERPRRSDLITAWGVCLAVTLVSSARADWPHLRGERYDGVSGETGLADSWPPEGPPRIWVRELGQGHSGFVVAEGRVFTQRQTPAGQYLLCLDPDTGETVWETRYDWAWQPRGAYPGPYASPTWYQGKVYYSSPTGLVGCLDAGTGDPIWSLNLREKFRGKGFDFGYAATPLVESGRVILPAGGPDASMVALGAEDGRTLWAVGSDPASYCPAMPIDFRGRRCVVGYLQNSFVIVESETGKLLYRGSLSSGYDEHSAWPLYREPDLLLLKPFRLPAERLRPEPGPGGSLLCRPTWSSRALCNDVVSSVLHEGHVYGFHLRQLQASKHQPSRGEFKCLEWETGKERWATDRVGHASVLVADGKLFLVNDSGGLVLARADPSSYQELARVQLFANEVAWTPPALWRGRLYVRGATEAVCLYVGRPENFPAGLSPSASARRSSRSWRFDPAWLLSHGRDFPNDAPTTEEMALWFWACVTVLVAAGLATAIVCTLAAHTLGKKPPGAPLFLGGVFLLGLLGPNVFSALADRCLFTWPVSLFAALFATILACLWAQGHPSPRRAAWIARLGIAGLLLVCYGYFELCKAVGMFVAWGFLFGLLPGFPLTCLAARASRQGRSVWVLAAWTLLAFASFFGGCHLFFLWKAAE